MAQCRIIELFEHDPAGSHLYNRLLIEAAIKDRLITACGQTFTSRRGNWCLAGASGQAKQDSPRVSFVAF